MSWPELLKAKENLQELSREINKLLKNHNSLTKKELARQEDALLAEFDASFAVIDGQLNEFMSHLKNHRKYIGSKSRFVRRHYNQNSRKEHIS